MEVIDDEDVLYRRVVPYFIVEDGKRVSSGAYKPKQEPHRISVDLARLTTPQETLARGGQTHFGVVSIKAGVPRSVGLVVNHDPNPPQEPGNYAHTLIEGENTQERRSAMAAASSIEIKPTQST